MPCRPRGPLICFARSSTFPYREPFDPLPEKLDATQNWIEQTLHLGHEAQRGVLVTALVAVTFLVLRWIVLRVVLRRVEDVRVRYLWRRFTLYLVFLLVAIVALAAWLGETPIFSTYLGLLSAGLAIALRDPLVNLAGWLFILWRRPFVVGDRIEIDTVKGDVIDSRLFQFSLMEIGNWVAADQSTGRVIHVPNGKVFSHALANFTSGFQFIWNELPIMVTFESDWRKAKDLLLEIANRHAEHLGEEAAQQVKRAAQKYMIFFRRLTPAVYTSVADSGVVLTIRYLCPPRQRRGTSQAIWEDVLDAFAAHDDIDFAYPTQRFYDNPVEGKPGARADRHD